MNWAGPEFVLTIIAISTAGWLVNNWIRARHGYALEDEWGGKTARADLQALEVENQELRQQVTRIAARFEERMRVVERIVTDKGYDVAHQIEALRNQPAPSLSEQLK